jgi:hypothetical protein
VTSSPLQDQPRAPRIGARGRPAPAGSSAAGLFVLRRGEPLAAGRGAGASEVAAVTRTQGRGRGGWHSSGQRDRPTGNAIKSCGLLLSSWVTSSIWATVFFKKGIKKTKFEKGVPVGEI